MLQWFINTCTSSGPWNIKHQSIKTSLDCQTVRKKRPFCCKIKLTIRNTSKVASQWDILFTLELKKGKDSNLPLDPPWSFKLMFRNGVPYTCSLRKKQVKKTSASTIKFEIGLFPPPSQINARNLGDTWLNKDLKIERWVENIYTPLSPLTPLELRCTLKSVLLGIFTLCSQTQLGHGAGMHCIWIITYGSRTVRNIFKTTTD